MRYLQMQNKLVKYSPESFISLVWSADVLAHKQHKLINTAIQENDCRLRHLKSATCGLLLCCLLRSCCATNRPPPTSGPPPVGNR